MLFGFGLSVARKIADECVILCGTFAGKYSDCVTCGLLCFCACMERSCAELRLPSVMIWYWTVRAASA